MFHTEGRTGRTYIFGTKTQTELERWMKLLACASYDFMKLMVVELQHKVNEIESRNTEERAEDEEGGRPCPPPRRPNPFNAGKDKHKYSWSDWHRLFGQQIQKDRELWLDQGTGAPAKKIEMEGENLLIEF